VIPPDTRKEISPWSVDTVSVSSPPNGGDIYAPGVAKTLNDGRFALIAGLRNNDDIPEGKLTELYDPVTQRWTSLPEMINKRLEGFTAEITKNNDILVIGGKDDLLNSEALDNVELYSSSLNKWLELPSLGETRAFHVSEIMQDGRIMVFGGSSNPNWLTSVFPLEHKTTYTIFDPVSRSWSETKSTGLAERPLHAELVQLENGVLMLVTDESILVYESKNDRWNEIGTLPEKRTGFAMEIVGSDSVVITGGTFEPEGFQSDTNSVLMITVSPFSN
jgi:hypothetical protein